MGVSQTDKWAELAFAAKIDCGFVLPTMLHNGGEVQFIDGLALVRSGAQFSWFDAALRCDTRASGAQCLQRMREFLLAKADTECSRVRESTTT